MLETIKNGFNTGVKTLKELDLGTVGKVAGGLLLLVGSAALTIAGTNAARGEHEKTYHTIPGEGGQVDAEAEPVDVETVVESEEAAK